MSVFSTIIKDLKSVASKIEAEFKKLFGEAPSWIAIATGVISYAGPIVTTIAQLIGGSAIGTEVGNILAAIKSKLATASAVVSSVDAATTLPALFTAIQADLPELLAAIKVSNPELVSKIETYTTLISGEIEALLSSIPPSTPAA